MATPLRFVVSHERYTRHFDENLAVRIAELLGGSEFSSSLEVIETDPDLEDSVILPDGKIVDLRVCSTEELRQQGIVLFGIGEGNFDDHRDGKRNPPCVAKRVADFLNLTSPRLQELLDYVEQADAAPQVVSDGVATLLKTVHDFGGPEASKSWLREFFVAWVLNPTYPEELDEETAQKLQDISRAFQNRDCESMGRLANCRIPNGPNADFRFGKAFRLILAALGQERALGWAKTIMEAMDKKEAVYKEALKMIEDSRGKELVIENGQLPENQVVIIGGAQYRIAVCRTKNIMFRAAARNGKVGADVVIQFNPETESILIEAKPGIYLSNVARIVRVLEIEAEPFGTADWDELAKPGRVPAAAKWFFFKEGEGQQFLAVRTLSSGREAPSVLPDEKIIEAVFIGLQNMLHPDHEQETCRGKYCPWYKYGLDCCRKFRTAQ